MPQNKTDQKFHIGDDAFSIQHMQRTGNNAMRRPHSHPSYELYYLYNGERVYFINGKVHTVCKGELVFIRPNELHATASSEKAEFERMLINFTGGFLQGADPSFTRLLAAEDFRLLRFTLREQAEIEHLLEQMLYECMERPPHYEAYVRSLLMALLIRMERADVTPQNKPEPSNPMHAKISEIATYIHRHYAEPLTLEQVAGRFFISPSYLSRVFNRLTGFHFGEYIQVIRVREAQRRLSDTPDKVQRIAEQVGYEHISHFNKTFKKHTGISPLQFRKSLRR